jgi:hypothetical protein
METMATACVNLSSDFLVQGKAAEAEAAIGRAIRLAEDIRKRDPRHAKARELLHMSYRSRGDLHARLGRFDAAFTDWEQSATLDARGEEYARQTPLTVQAMRRLIQGDHRGASAMIEALHKDFADRVDMNLTFRFAWIYTLAAAAARQDAHLNGEEQSSLADSYHRKAIDALMSAQRAGYFKVNLRRRLLQIDPILTPLRERTDFLVKPATS